MPTEEWRVFPWGTRYSSGQQRFMCGGSGHTYVNEPHPAVGEPPVTARICRAGSRVYLNNNADGEPRWSDMDADYGSYGARCGTNGGGEPQISICACSYDGGASTVYTYRMHAFSQSITYFGSHFCGTDDPLPPATPRVSSPPPPPPPLIGAVRLVGGTVVSSGRVEVRDPQGAWGTVGDNGFNLNAANVVCKQLGYRRAIGFRCCSYYGGFFGDPTTRVVLDHLRCTGFESKLAGRRHDPLLCSSAPLIISSHASPPCSSSLPHLVLPCRLPE